MIGTLFLLALLSLVLLCSVQVARCPDLVHSVLWLAVTLLSTACVLVWLAAPFLAGIQIVLYTGGVITLMLFGVMLTHRDATAVVPNPIQRPAVALVAAVTLLAILLAAIWRTPELAPAAMSPQHEVTTLQIGQVLLAEQLLAFEVLSVLLLAAMVGAIVLSRRKDP